MDIERLCLFLRAERVRGGEQALDEGLARARRELVLLDVVRRLALQRVIGERDERLRLSHREHAAREIVLHLLIELHEPQEIRDMGAAAPHLGGERLLREVELLEETRVRPRLLDGAEILALQVLDERDLARLRIVIGAHDGGDLREPRELRRAQAALARDELIAALGQTAHEDGLQDTVGPHRLLELLHRRLIELRTRLEPVRADVADGELLDLALLRRHLRAFAEQRAEALAAETAAITFFHA